MIDADHNATTACRPEVVEAVVRCLVDVPWSPSARGHGGNRAAQAEVDRARAAVAALVGGHEDEITFTSGATEALNLGIFGVAERFLAAGERTRFLAGATEHSAVREPLAKVAAAGGRVHTIPVDGAGRLGPIQADQGTALVATMLVNNETGVMHAVAAASATAHAVGALLLCDATQAAGRAAIDVAALGCDMLAISAHKFQGPKGIGCLWRRRGLGLSAQVLGGGQEGGLRGGTLNVPAIAGFGVAAHLATHELPQRSRHLAGLTKRLEDQLCAALPGVRIHGAATIRAPGTTMVTLPGLAPGWLRALTRTRAASASACTQAAGLPSHVLSAMGVAPDEAGNALRLSFGPQTTAAEVDLVATDVIAAVARLGRGP